MEGSVVKNGSLDPDKMFLDSRTFYPEHYEFEPLFSPLCDTLSSHVPSQMLAQANGDVLGTTSPIETLDNRGDFVLSSPAVAAREDISKSHLPVAPTSASSSSRSLSSGKTLSNAEIRLPDPLDQDDHIRNHWNRLKEQRVAVSNILDAMKIKRSELQGLRDQKDKADSALLDAIRKQSFISSRAVLEPLIQESKRCILLKEDAEQKLEGLIDDHERTEAELENEERQFYSQVASLPGPLAPNEDKGLDSQPQSGFPLRGIAHSQTADIHPLYNDLLESLDLLKSLGDRDHQGAKEYPMLIAGKSTVRLQRSKERSYLPVIVNGERIDAFPDTNATCNTMTKEYALATGATIDFSPARRRVFTNAIGMQSHSVGETTLDVSFPDDPTRTWKCKFAIVQQCPAPVVFGDHFLRHVTKTLTLFRHRLKKAVSALKGAWRIMHMEVPRQRLGCYLDSELALANMDTGSDIDMISFEYAKIRGWNITTLPDDEGYVILSDTTVAKVSGYVDTSLGIREVSQKTRFYVLDGLVCDVLLGDHTLDKLDVFNKHAEHFVDVDDDNGAEDFYMIEWVEHFDRAETDIEQLLKQLNLPNASPSPEVAEETVQGGWRRRARTAWFKKPITGNSTRDVRIELRRRLQDLDIIEDQLTILSSEKVAGGCAGKELALEQERNATRKERYRQLRLKILTHLNSQSTGSTGTN